MAGGVDGKRFLEPSESRRGVWKLESVRFQIHSASFIYTVLLTSRKDMLSVIQNVFEHQLAIVIDVDGANDDVLWWSLAWAKVFNVIPMCLSVWIHADVRAHWKRQVSQTLNPLLRSRVSQLE